MRTYFENFMEEYDYPDEAKAVLLSYTTNCRGKKHSGD